MVVDVTSAGGSRYGLIWRAFLGLNEATGKAELDLLGQKTELASLAQALQPGAAPIRSAQQARSFVGYLAAHMRWLTSEQVRQFGPRMGDDVKPLQVAPHPLTTGQGQQVSGLFQKLYRDNLDFGSSAIGKALAEAEAGGSAGLARAALPDQRFAPDVLTGKFQAMARTPGNSGHTLVDGQLAAWIRTGRAEVAACGQG